MFSFSCTKGKGAASKIVVRVVSKQRGRDEKVKGGKKRREENVQKKQRKLP
jgi:hypothetical protein